MNFHRFAFAIFLSVAPPLAQAMSEDVAHSAFMRLDQVYHQELAAQGWDFRYVSMISADRFDPEMKEDGAINVKGDVTQSHLSRDALTLVFCHELGHRIGGYPKKIRPNWPSVESQADYFATARCMPRVLQSEPLPQFTSSNPKAHQTCAAVFSNERDMSVCERTVMAAAELAAFFQPKTGELPAVLGKQSPMAPTILNTIDPHQPPPEYPDPQCRLQTYVAGALCTDDRSLPLGQTLETSSCVAATALSERPTCWMPHLKSYDLSTNTDGVNFDLKVSLTPLSRDVPVHLQDATLGTCDGQAEISDGALFYEGYYLKGHLSCQGGNTLDFTLEKFRDIIQSGHKRAKFSMGQNSKTLRIDARESH